VEPNWEEIDARQPITDDDVTQSAVLTTVCEPYQDQS